MDLENKRILITGGTGMIGSRLVEVLLEETNDNIVLIVRDECKARDRFVRCGNDDRLELIKGDLGRGEVPYIDGRIDAIIHLACNTHPRAYVEHPISTIMMNVSATQKLLEIANVNKGCRFLYASTVEVYGQNRGDTELFNEKYCGYIDCNTLRAGYPESKRCGEALCQAYITEKGVDCVIARLARTYGPTLLKTDTKALSQFIWNALSGHDIVLKSKGDQYFSYLHCEDAVSAILTILEKGICGEAYNVADDKSDIRLRDLANLIAGYAGRKVIYDLPDATEAAGFSTATIARLDSAKLKALGWRARYDIASGVRQTINSLKED